MVRTKNIEGSTGKHDSSLTVLDSVGKKDGRTYKKCGDRARSCMRWFLLALIISSAVATVIFLSVSQGKLNLGLPGSLGNMSEINAFYVGLGGGVIFATALSLLGISFLCKDKPKHEYTHLIDVSS